MNKIKKKESKYTQVSNSFLRDKNISFKAKGLFCYMYSMDEKWNFTMQSIATQQNDGLSSIKSAMDELKEFGYIVYEKHANGKGTYHLDDVPNVENPNVENPNLGKSTPIKNTNLDKNTNTSSSADYEKFSNLWNEFATKVNKPKIAKLTDSRKKKIALRLKEYKNLLEIYEYVLKKSENSQFLLNSNFYTFDWLFENDTNILKVYEGKYDNGKNQEVVI